MESKSRSTSKKVQLGLDPLFSGLLQSSTKRLIIDYVLLIHPIVCFAVGSYIFQRFAHSSYRAL
jgi:hypothetical protein